ncbi:putative acyl-CoA dehydrogenase AidB [bacterium BMS3Abin02]|nr:putative acyl-CoA dehydrogenase AidB [bacterium BMS3Abin02]GBE21534.1 putative acyl-CoA dehydrogenase AidB [bacterium BMS3Bbin01]HDH25780.1 acyl-CoA dehydrogenase [Actinomycetota bacterium]HDK45946.1 acyl-CoA dehydrogenase [Actinomycetota bacterium]
MTVYAPPLDEFSFVLNHLLGLERLTALPRYSELDADLIDAILSEAGKFLTEQWFPLNKPGDEVGSTFADGAVTAPEGFKEAYEMAARNGWLSTPFDEAHGGGQLPQVIVAAITEMLDSTNASLSIMLGLTQGAAHALIEHASDDLVATFVPKLVSGEWSGTMNLTEPQAGSDVGALITKAIPQPDGTYRLTGTKSFISWGDQDITENIIHLVLARTPDSPPGTKGISMFVVPKYLVNPDGSLGERNDVKTVSIEHKLGIRASATCVIAYGDDGDGAVGYIVGEEHKGMHYMFTMMNAARVEVGISGTGIGEVAYQNAVQYAQERIQGRPIGAPKTVSVAIIEHPDVRRMLMTMKAKLDAMRAIELTNALAFDLATSHPDESERQKNQLFAELLTPITKAWLTDMGIEITGLASQVYGGMGFIEDSGIPQYYRDARIGPIYEGTNGIQAMDLVGRRLPMASGATIMGLIAEMKAIDGELEAAGERFSLIRTNLSSAVEAVEKATGWLATNGMQDPNQALAGATPYLRMLGSTLGAYYLAREALIASALLDEGAENKEFLEAKIVTARFYAEQLLPQDAALFGAVTAGNDLLAALEPEQF